MKKDKKNTNKNDEVVERSEEAINESTENEETEEKKPRRVMRMLNVAGAAICIATLGLVACMVAALKLDSPGSNENSDVPLLDKDNDADEESNN